MSYISAAFVGVSLGEILEARTVLEVELAGLAAQRATEEDLRAIEHNLQRMASRIRESDAAFAVVDADFHTLVAKAGSNRVLTDLLLKVYSMMRQEIRKALEVEGAVERSLGYHQMIYEALRSRDVAEARRRMYLHMADVRARVMELKNASSAV